MKAPAFSEPSPLQRWVHHLGGSPLSVDSECGDTATRREGEMVPSFCGAMGVAGWVVMLLVWGVLIAAVVWGITRLFPDSTNATVPAPPLQRHREDAQPPLVESHRH
jgi:hypothetical protein